jgi:hypothetical protein
MGTVYLAEQTTPVRRMVALKVIKAGMDSRQVLARFDAERQALALMDHPNIARVLDAGATPDGRPYFVMELVKGVPITRFCDDRRLTPRERLELFIPVCQAVQHAHQKGIIHRDLKPSNVLVGLYDGVPVPKVIDFGVAKAAGQKLTEATLFTGFGAVVGTPEYMSPEQAQLDNLDIDTRSDVYALGVLLYELLTGTTPLDRRRLKEAAILEVLRVIREEDPPRPSTRLSTTEELPSIAAYRNVEPRRLSGLLRGELDWIVMKALEKDRNRRYETANGLARDVQRYLADEVVEARPPSAGYRLRKFVRRHKGRVLAAALVLLALVAGTIGTTWGYLRAERARQAEARRAESERRANLEAQQQKAAAEAANSQAQRRLEQIKKGNEVLAGIFAELDIHKVKEGDRPLEAVLADRLVKAAGDLEGESVGDPLAVAVLQVQLGWSLVSLGFAAQAVPMLEKARATIEAGLGPDHPDTLLAMKNLAAGYQSAGKLDRALPLLEETLQLTRAKLGPDHPETLTAMSNLAVGYGSAGEPDRALPLFEEALRLKKARLGPDHPDTLLAMSNLAEGYRGAGKLDLALPLLEESFRLAKAKLGPDHPQTLTAMGSLAEGYRAARKLDLALPLCEEALRLKKAKLGPDHAQTLESMNNLAGFYWSLGQWDKSIPLLEEVVIRQTAAFGRQHTHTLLCVANLGINYREAGRLVEALPLLEEVYRAGRKNPALRVFGPELLDGYAQAKKTTEVTALARELLDDARSTLSPESPALARQLAHFGRALLAVRSFADAEPLLRESLSIRERKEPDDWTTFNSRSLLGGALLGQNQFAAAEPLLLAGYEGLKKREKTIQPVHRSRLAEAAGRLVDLYTATNRPDELKRWQAERALYPEHRNSPLPETK